MIVVVIITMIILIIMIARRKIIKIEVIITLDNNESPTKDERACEIMRMSISNKESLIQTLIV